MSTANDTICQHGSEVAAYLDGELSLPDEAAFEQHLTVCPSCSNRLNEQKRLLCALDFAFDDEKSFEIPIDFARTIAVKAESDVSGLNTKEERRRALIFAALLFLAGIAVGIIGKKAGFFENLLARALSISSVFFGFCYDLCIGAVVILRAVSRQFITESTFSAYLLLFLLIFSIAALSLLLSNKRSRI